MPDPREETPGETPLDAVSAGASFRGLVLVAGPARILGRVEGELIGSGRLEVGAGAEVAGPVVAPEIRVAGCVEGDLRASLRVELTATARVRGRIDTPKLAAADGSQVDGACAVGRPPSAGESPAES